MSKRLKTGKSRASSAVKAVVKGSRSAAASALSTVSHRKEKVMREAATGSWSYTEVKRVEHTHQAPGVADPIARHADPSLLDPYDWGPEGVPTGKPLRYVPGQGFVVED